MPAECATEGCENEAQSEYCSACKSSFYYWNKRRPGHILQRRSKLRLYEARLDARYDKDGHLKGRGAKKR